MIYVNFSVNGPKFDPKWLFFYFQHILAAIFVTIATVKVELISDFYTLAIVSINSEEGFGEKQFLFLAT